VVLSNEDGTLDRSQVVSAAGTENVGGVSEITIKRRVKETEDNYYSYYYLNGRSVNLSDVQDLLARRRRHARGVQRRDAGRRPRSST